MRVLIKSTGSYERILEILERIVDHGIVVDVWSRHGGVGVIGTDRRFVALVGDVPTIVPPVFPPSVSTPRAKRQPS